VARFDSQTEVRVVKPIFRGSRAPLRQGVNWVIPSWASPREYVAAFAYLIKGWGRCTRVSIGRESDQIRRFEKHVLVHLNDVYRPALRLTGHAADAEDLVQETCLRAFKALDQLQHLAAAKVWVFSILRSTSLRQVASAGLAEVRSSTSRTSRVPCSLRAMRCATPTRAFFPCGTLWSKRPLRPS
jgi:hypothetical protein